MTSFAVYLNHQTSGPMVGCENMKIGNELLFAWERWTRRQHLQWKVKSPLTKGYAWCYGNTREKSVGNSNCQIATRKL